MAKVFDASGKLLERFVAGASVLHPIQGLTEGMYLLRVEEPKRSVWSGKFVIVH
jgi:hypothetical protein